VPPGSHSSRSQGAPCYAGFVATQPAHAPAAGRVLVLGLALTLAFAAVELGTSFATGALALASDAAHMLVDSAGLLLALVATLVARRPADLQRSYGYARVEVLVVPLHVILMLGLAGYIAYEGVSRFGAPPAVDGWPVLAVGVVGLGVNLLVMRMLHGHSAQNLNVRGAFFEVAADAIGSVGVILAAVVLITTGWNRIDVIVSLAIAAFVVPRAVALLRLSLGILLEATPPGIELEALERDAAAVPGVLALHDLHVWALAPSFLALSAHVEVSTMERCEQQLGALVALFRERYGISHLTLQPETRALHEALACCEFPDAAVDHDHIHEDGEAVPLRG